MMAGKADNDQRFRKRCAMNQTAQNTQIQVRLPESGELCTFSVDSNTRFSDIFHALIGKGCFACPQGEHPVWVLLCCDQDLVT